MTTPRTVILGGCLLALVASLLAGCASGGGGAGAPLVEMRFESGWTPAGAWRLELEGDGLVTLRSRDWRSTTFQLDAERLGAIRAAVDALRLGRRSGISSAGGETSDLALIVVRTPSGLSEVRVEAPRRARCTGTLERVAPIWNTLVEAARLHFEGRDDRLFGICGGRRLD